MSRIPYSKIRKLMKGKPYTMQLSRSDAPSVVNAVNLGIDSHLEACFIPTHGDRYEWENGKLTCVISDISLPTLLRRLYEADTEASISLADDILSTLSPSR